MSDATHSKTYGYARVSTREQNLDRQLRALEEFGVERGNIFADKASGRDFARPEWIRLTGALRAGDVLVVKSIDRFGRSYEEILDQWRAITRERGAEVVVLDMPLLDTRQGRDGVTGALISDIVLQLLSYVAQVERESIHQRQAEGIAAARARGVRFGRPEKKRPRATGRPGRAIWRAASRGRSRRRASRSRCPRSTSGCARTRQRRWGRRLGNRSLPQVDGISEKGGFLCTVVMPYASHLPNRVNSSAATRSAMPHRSTISSMGR